MIRNSLRKMMESALFYEIGFAKRMVLKRTYTTAND